MEVLLSFLSIESDHDGNICHLVVFISPVLLVDGVIVLLPVGVVDALADLFGGVTHLLFCVVGAILQNLGPSSVQLLHLSGQVNGCTGCSGG